jgi:hypothetical protein
VRVHVLRVEMPVRLRGASIAASAVVIGIEAIKPIDPISEATISSATDSLFTASVNGVPPIEKIRRTGSAAPLPMSCRLNDSPWKRRAACKAALRLTEVLSCRYSMDRLAGHQDR